MDGFPYLNEKEYLEALKRSICKKQAMIIKDEKIIIGAMAFNSETGSIDFLGIHPQYRKKDMAKAFMQKALGERFHLLYLQWLRRLWGLESGDF